MEVVLRRSPLRIPTMVVAASCGAFASVPSPFLSGAPAAAVAAPGADIVVREAVVAVADAALAPNGPDRLGVTLYLPDVSDVFVGIFDNLGVSVTSFTFARVGTDLPAAERTTDGRWRLDIDWNGRSAAGVPAPRGVYVWKIVVRSPTGGTIETTRKLGLR